MYKWIWDEGIRIGVTDLTAQNDIQGEIRASKLELLRVQISTGTIQLMTPTSVRFPNSLSPGARIALQSALKCIALPTDLTEGPKGP